MLYEDGISKAGQRSQCLRTLAACTGPGFVCQHSHGCSEHSVTPVPGDQCPPGPVGTRHIEGAQTCRQAGAQPHVHLKQKNPKNPTTLKWDFSCVVHNVWKRNVGFLVICEKLNLFP